MSQMPNEETMRYPRVLVVYMPRINVQDGHGLILRNLFAGWPRASFAQIYASSSNGDEGFFGSYYQMGSNDRRLGKLFYKLRGPIREDIAGVEVKSKTTSSGRPSVLRRCRRLASMMLTDFGIWEIIFKPQISEAMAQFIRDFKPDVIYCQGYSLGFCWLPLAISKAFGIPICFQTTDDWPQSLYERSPLRWLMKPVRDRVVAKIVNQAKGRIAFGPPMQQAYTQRYGCKWDSVLLCDELRRFDEAPSTKLSPGSGISIAYTGNLLLGRWISMLELCNAAEKVSAATGISITVHAFVSRVPEEGLAALNQKSNLQTHALPTHEELPSVLKSADILFLPETFEPGRAKDIGLSISSKAHLYMAAGRPILIYGSPATGVVKYAKDYHWACVVDHQGSDPLAEGLSKLLNQPDYSGQMKKTGRATFGQFHDSSTVRREFCRIISAAAGQKCSSDI